MPDTHCRPEAAEAAEGPNVGKFGPGFFSWAMWKIYGCLKNLKVKMDALLISRGY